MFLGSVKLDLLSITEKILPAAPTFARNLELFFFFNFRLGDLLLKFTENLTDPWVGTDKWIH